MSEKKETKKEESSEKKGWLSRTYREIVSSIIFAMDRFLETFTKYLNPVVLGEYIAYVSLAAAIALALTIVGYLFFSYQYTPDVRTRCLIEQNISNNGEVSHSLYSTREFWTDGYPVKITTTASFEEAVLAAERINCPLR